MAIPDALEAYSVTLLRCADHYLLLQRSTAKTFAPGRWTGLGGRVEADEYGTLRAAALREVQEEAGLLPHEISRYTLRRLLLVCRPGRPFTVLLYFTGELRQPVTPACPEGWLNWKRSEDFGALDIIETTRPVLNLLVQDMAADPPGETQPAAGMAVFRRDGTFARVMWAEAEE